MVESHFPLGSRPAVKKIYAPPSAVSSSSGNSNGNLPTSGMVWGRTNFCGDVRRRGKKPFDPKLGI